MLPRVREGDREHLVRAGVALREEPLPAALPVLPPLALLARDVVAEVHVVGQLTQRRRRPGPVRDLAEVGELVHGPRPAVGAWQHEGHRRRLDGGIALAPTVCQDPQRTVHRMARTRQPSTRRIGAAERAIAVLDTLADGGELGTNEIARRTGMTPSTVSRQLGTLAAAGLVERVAAIGPLPPRSAHRLPRERDPRPARRPRGRPPPPRGARARHGRERHALGSR